jgi:hypothetical protein
MVGVMTDTGEHDREGRRAKPHGLVRPYVLGTGGSAQRRPMQRDAGEHLTRGDQPTFDWTGEQGPGRTSEARSDSTGRDAPTKPRGAAAPLPAVKSAGSHRASARGRRQALWLAAAAAGVAALAIVGGIILFLSRPPTKPLAHAPARAHKVIRRSHPTARHSATGPSPAPARTHPTPNPTKSSPAPTSTATAGPTRQPVKVSYAVVRQHPHNFQGQFTIVNHGSTAINGWELVVVLPGDDIRSVQDGLFHTDGDTLYIDPPQFQRSIAPGATLTENFTAHGSTTTLASCTFNGSAC